MHKKNATVYLIKSNPNLVWSQWQWHEVIFKDSVREMEDLSNWCLVGYKYYPLCHSIMSLYGNKIKIANKVIVYNLYGLKTLYCIIY